MSTSRLKSCLRFVLPISCALFFAAGTWAIELPARSPKIGKITRFATRLEGDHSLEAATITEGTAVCQSLYFVRLQFASGIEQSFVISAPPGGLRPEVRDMSGDNVPNDVVLTSGLLQVPVAVLLNQGQDHLSLAASPPSFSSEDSCTTGQKAPQGVATLPRFGLSWLVTTNAEFVVPKQAHSALANLSSLQLRTGFSSPSAGRAPPLR